MLLSAQLPWCRVKSANSRSTPGHTGVPYRLLGLWRVELPVGRAAVWRRVDIQPVSTRLFCNRTKSVARLAGLPKLPVGTYFVMAESFARTDWDFLYVGPGLCNDVRIGLSAPGSIPLCVLQRSNASARIVPDPLCVSKFGAHVGKLQRSGRLSFRRSGLKPPTDLREAVCLARELMRWPSRLVKATQTGSVFTIQLRRDSLGMTIPSARVRIDPTRDQLEVLHNRVR